MGGAEEGGSWRVRETITKQTVERMGADGLIETLRAIPEAGLVAYVGTQRELCGEFCGNFYC